MENIRIGTAQNVDLLYEVAPFGDRTIAYIVDTLLMIAWMLLVWIAVDIAGGNAFDGVPFILFIVLPFWLYFLLCEIYMNGQSVGKRVAKVRVVRLDGEQPTTSHYLLRWLLRPVDSLYFLGVLVVLLSNKGQRLGDLVAGTTVISTKPRRTLQETLGASVKEDHVVRYAQASLLSDAQAQLVKDVLMRSRSYSDTRVLHELAAKVRGVIGADGQQPDREFLETVLRDHAFITSR